MFEDFQALKVGETRSLTKRIEEADVRKFIELTGDDNPLHANQEFAETTAFRGIVVHGMLSASLISTVIGTKLPGPGALWVAQNLEFLLPVRLGDELTVSCTILRKHEGERLLELDARIINQHQQVVVRGEGKVKVLAQSVVETKTTAPDYPKVAIVTGAGGGIGSAISLRLARAGYRVVINYLHRRDRAEALVQKIKKLDCAQTEAVAVQADVSRESDAEKLYKATVQYYGGVGVLINNASGSINPKAFANTEWADLQGHLDVQLKGAFLMAKACVPEMCSRRRGRIINISSQVTEGSPSINWTGYAVAKAALVNLSRYLAAELGPTGVTVNCVSPGMTETGLIGEIPEKAQMIIARQTPLRRLAASDDIAGAVSYLVSDEASYVTGQVLRVNGGMVMV